MISPTSVSYTHLDVYKRQAINLVANKYVLNKNGRNYLERKVFSDDKSKDRSHKIVNITNVTNKTIFVDGYNVLISVETICNREYGSLVMCDDEMCIRDRVNKSLNSKYSNNFFHYQKCVNLGYILILILIIRFIFNNKIRN